MKKYLNLLFLFLFTITITSCSSEDSAEEPQPQFGIIKATIDGVLWQSNTATGTIQDGLDDRITVAFQGSSVNNLFEIFNLSIDTSKLGVNSFNSNGFFPEAQVNSNIGGGEFSSNESGGSCLINVTSISLVSNKVNGTFTATVKDPNNGQTKQITNGEFIDIPLEFGEVYTNGTMSLKKGTNSPISIDGINENTYIWLFNDPLLNSVRINGVYLGTNTSSKGSYSITIPKNITPGTYNFDDNNYLFFVDDMNTSNEEFSTNTGSITINSNTAGNIVGTFSYSASNGSQTINITQGSFNVNVQ